MSSSKVVVVTGASEGIGAELARRLGTAGHRVVLAARREQELARAAAAAEPGALAVVADVRRPSDVEKLRDRALEAFGGIDVWINNAGRGIAKPVLELTEADFDEMMSVNVKSALFGMQAAVAHFKERGRGQLINISSFLGRVPIASHRSAYNAAKAALNSLTANVRMDLKRDFPEIRVTLVMPGMVKTNFAVNAIDGIPNPPAPPGSIQPQTTDEVAGIIASLIDHPVPELFTNPLQADIARKYFENVAEFEANL